jgi:hypothetical protein
VQPAPGAQTGIAVILPRGEAIRNFVYTESLDEIAAHTRLAVLSVFPTEQTMRLLRDRYETVLELVQAPEKWILRLQREILDMAHGRWLWSEGARLRWERRDLESSGSIRRAKRWVKKLACYPFANPAGLELLSRLESASSGRLGANDYYVSLFQKLKPSLVFNGSHVHGEAAIQAIRAARRLGIPTAAFIFSWDNLTSQGRIMPPYDFYLVWNEALAEQLLRIYPFVRPHQVAVTGTPQFDFHFRPEFSWTRQEFCERVGADPVRPILLYSTGMANHMPGEQVIVERIADMIGSIREPVSPQLLVRVYPKDRTNRFDELRQRRKDILFPEAPWDSNWLTPRMEDSYLWTNMLRHAAAGINVASTVTLELCMFDKPCINVAYNPPGIDVSPVDYARYYRFDHYRQVVDSGAVMLAHSESDLLEGVRSALTRPSERAHQRRLLVDRMFGNTLDGQSGRRVADQLFRLADRTGKPKRRWR